jgi:hypothetical protein
MHGGFQIGTTKSQKLPTPLRTQREQERETRPREVSIKIDRIESDIRRCTSIKLAAELGGGGLTEVRPPADFAN